MTSTPRLITRVALFAALIYVFSWATLYLPNVKVIFFVIFSAGFLWGHLPGILVGVVGMGLWTVFNPYGPAGPPVTMAQMIGAGLCGPVGALFFRSGWQRHSRWSVSAALAVAAILCTVLYYVPVNVVDAWVYQPFWPRFFSALPWTSIALVSNMFIFPLLFPVTRFVYERENGLR